MPPEETASPHEARCGMFDDKMPVGTLKSDKRLAEDMEICGGIVATTVAISRQIRLEAVAEGVETEAQLHRLEPLSCHGRRATTFPGRIPATTSSNISSPGMSAKAGNLSIDEDLIL